MNALQELDAWLSDMPEHWHVRPKVEALRAKVARLVEALDDCEDYFDNRADADCEGDPLQFVPNKEMRLLSQVREALGREA